MGLIRYDSSVEECCCLGFLSARNALNSGSVLAAPKKKKEEKLWDGTGICILKLDFDLDRGRILIYSTHGVQDLHIQVIQLLSFLICQNVSLTFYAQTHLTIQILVSILLSLKLGSLFPTGTIYIHIHQ